ncbi:Restriction endonuclease type II-like protein [Gracilaria domingensis]|nr:Restriction endonuclease type II-like protein [Gracilaria domingensis]
MSLSSCSSPSTPEPESDRPALQHVALPLAPTSPPNAPETAPPTTELGSLDLMPCSLEEYFDIDTSRFGKYEYVDGILVALPMADKEHENIVSYLTNDVRVKFVREEESGYPEESHGLAIPRSASSPASPHRGRIVRRPDASVSEPLSPSTRAQLSPKSRRISNPVRGRVKTVLEVTSQNEKTDTVVKVPEYEKAEVQTYVKVVRDMQCKDETKRDKRVEVLRLDPSSKRYGPNEVYRGETPADMGSFGTHKPSTLFGSLDPASPLKKLSEEMKEGKKREQEAMKREQEAKKREQEAMKREQEAKKREQEAMKREQEGKKREQEAMKREQEAKKREQVAMKREQEAKKREQEAKKRERAATAKKKHYKSILKTNLPGEVLSSSSGSPDSSKSSSPAKKKHRTRKP